jgi:hypothetical protein
MKINTIIALVLCFCVVILQAKE